jgi:hypothetical protein
MKILGSMLSILFLAACGGEAVSGSGHEPTPGAGGGFATGGSAGGTSSTGGAGSAGSAGATSSGGASGTPGSAGAAGTGAAECVPQEDVSWPPLEAACEHLWVLDVSNPIVIDQNGDGVVSPGETAEIRVELSEVAGYGWNMYPGVDFTSDHPGVSVKWYDWYYAIFACQTHPAGANVVVAKDVAPGTQVTITARVAMLGAECPLARSIQIPLTIQ